MTNNQGYKIEDLVQKICSKMFIADFIVRNPLYKKKSGMQKEAADLLVLFMDTLLVYQVKSKKEIKMASQKTEIDFNRIQKKIEEAIGQFSKIKEALKHNLISEVKNSIGINLPFSSEKFNKVIGLIVLDLPGEEKFTQEERTAIYNGFHFDADISIHVFLREDLELIASEIDTLPDFISYLNIREKLYQKGLLMSFTVEKDFLAFFLCKTEELIKILSEKEFHLIIDQSMWKDYQENNKKFIEERLETNKTSYLIDDIITQQHSVIGYTPELNHQMWGLLVPDSIEESTRNYFSAITELASLTRKERKFLGDRLLHVMRNADEDRGNQISTIYIEKNKEAFLVFATKESRAKRALALRNYAEMAYCKLGLKKISAIATENISAQKRSYDFIHIENMVFENHDFIVDKAKALFNFKNLPNKPL